MNEAADALSGVVVSKLEPHGGGPLRGYIAMLAVREQYRGRGIATRLVRMAIDAMIERGADEVSFITTRLIGRLSMHLRLRLPHRSEANANGAARLPSRPKSRIKLR